MSSEHDFQAENNNTPFAFLRVFNLSSMKPGTRDGKACRLSAKFLWIILVLYLANGSCDI